MADGFLKRGMKHLGLVEDGYEDDDVAMYEEDPVSPVGSHEPGDEEGFSPAPSIQTVKAVLGEGVSSVSQIRPRIKRARSTELSPHVHAVTPIEFADARQIADAVLAGQPVIVNLQNATRELKRRLIDFCSGVAYSIGGDMERVASDVFLVTPSNVELSAEERQRA